MSDEKGKAMTEDEHDLLAKTLEHYGMQEALAAAQSREDWPTLSGPDLFCRGFEQGWLRRPGAERTMRAMNGRPWETG